jgi:two-component system chemotaxis response regulator CheB
MRLKKDEKGYYVACKKGEKVSGHCPSVDVLFDSVAELAAKDSVGIILTGMGRDGASGLLNMKKAGAFTIGQDEKTSVVYGMPMVAYNIGAVAVKAAIEDISDILIKHLTK